MKFFAVISSVLAAASAEAQLPIAAQYLAGAGLYNGYNGYQGYAAAPYAAAYGAVDRRFAYGAPINALNAGPLTAGPVAVAAAAPLVATAPIVGAQYAAAYAAAPVAVAAAPAVYAAAPAPVTSSQFQAQDEDGNIAYGYQNINSAKQERGNTYGGVEGSYSYVDEAGVHTVNYVADDFGFRVVGDNLPVHQAVAPVFTGVAPLPVQETAEVLEARAAFHAAYDAINSRNKRSAQFGLGPLVAHANGAVVPHDTPAVVAARAAHAAAGGAIHPVAAYAGYPVGLAGAYAGYPAGLNGAYGYAAGLAAPVAAYAAAPVAAYAAAPVAAPLAYAAAPAIAAAAPAREAVLTTIKLNPGHATFYRVD